MSEEWIDFKVSGYVATHRIRISQIVTTMLEHRTGRRKPDRWVVWLSLTDSTVLSSVFKTLQEAEEVLKVIESHGR